MNVLDVHFDRRVVGTDGVPLSVIPFDDNSSNKMPSNAARLWTINSNGTVSPTRSPELVIDIRGFKLPPSLEAASTPRPLTGDAKVADVANRKQQLRRTSRRGCLRKSGPSWKTCKQHLVGHHCLWWDQRVHSAR